MGRLCELARRPDVRAATGATDGLDLMSKVPLDVLWRISDRDLSAFAVLFSDSLGELSPSDCAGFAPRPGSDWGAGFMTLAAAADSALSVRWAAFLEAGVWTYV